MRTPGWLKSGGDSWGESGIVLLSWEERQPSGSTPLPFSAGETETPGEQAAAQAPQASGSGARAVSSEQTPSGKPAETVLARPHGAGGGNRQAPACQRL